MSWSDQRQTASSATHGNRRWRQLRSRRLHLDHFQCQLQIKGVCLGHATVVDVVVPISVTGPRRIALDQIQSACGPCHAKKTAIEASAAAAAKRKRNSRRRPPPEHPSDYL